ncbi:MAG: cation diffusion facilitator family transporter [Saprospiraceae bacterium]|nr:cation diffusion facilitator family transporter [Saprospiraceae bacterium]HMW40155.1 cation diffusion facilitator family transporter [Saprospiraceae bacterium]HMX88961.1 cation diffusion facilitator family transporter [Saprospiraceae bacterium]HMZ40168.1 cation diffusion facilitator family transporter [Saprospiraceae bacterium]HNA64900.1 cation diffusion facilitator family transporter [Saprospiraceae bacterium]
MASSHTHSHHHHDHDHSRIAREKINTAFLAGISLNLIFVMIQIVVGLRIHSLALLSDAGHNFADVGSLFISMIAFRLLRSRSNPNYTYGYRKTSVLTALFNAMLLLVSIGAILYEAAHRFLNPEPVQGLTIAWISAIGIAINAGSAFLFYKDKNKDINLRSAFVHLLGDAVISIGLVMGGVIIWYTQWYWLDSLLGVIVAVIILWMTWSLFKESMRLSLDGVPHHIDLLEVRKEALAIPGIAALHHLHVWAISTTENAMTAHLVLAKEFSANEIAAIKTELRHSMHHLGIHHLTLETEVNGQPCSAEDCD